MLHRHQRTFFWVHDSAVGTVRTSCNFRCLYAVVRIPPPPSQLPPKRIGGVTHSESSGSSDSLVLDKQMKDSQTDELTKVRNDFKLGTGSA